ncbi:MAG: isoprenyl transferase [Gammaproteobacteria bacterium]|nr:isoprenyl transferase [Gammaproteobacteria bacterium]
MTPSKIPRHIAIIMDGNGRWAKKRLLPRFAGHQQGMESVRKVVKKCIEDGVEVLTLFAFSSENWKRPAEEVGLLMKLFVGALDREVRKLHKNGVSLRIVGDITAFPDELQQRIVAAEKMTADNRRLYLNIAANYGGRWDIVEATKKLAYRVKHGSLGVEEITSELLAQELVMADLPEPDLFIRTGGEERISNFLLWQLAYCELYFTQQLWPEFDESSLQQAIDSFGSRQRRFGMTGEQVEDSAS